MEKSRTTQGRTLSALAVAGTLAVFLAEPAAAQTSGNLKCNGCVSSKDIKNKGIKSKDIKDGQVKNADLGNKAIDLNKLTPELQEKITKNRTFFGTAETDGEEVTLATNGPLTIFMLCTINDGGFDRVDVIVTSSLGPWFVGEKTTPLSAGETSIFSVASETTNAPAIDSEITVSVFAADGSAFSAGGSVTTALNLAGHRCMAFGDATALKGEL